MLHINSPTLLFNFWILWKQSKALIPNTYLCFFYTLFGCWKVMYWQDNLALVNRWSFYARTSQNWSCKLQTRLVINTWEASSEEGGLLCYHCLWRESAAQPLALKTRQVSITATPWHFCDSWLTKSMYSFFLSAHHFEMTHLSPFQILIASSHCWGKAALWLIVFMLSYL